jgi:putative endopeptidase
MRIPMQLLSAAAISALITGFPSHAKVQPQPLAEAGTKDVQVKSVTKEDEPEIGSFGFDVGGMDTSVPAGENFYRYANGKWSDATAIPADKSNYGMFTALGDLSNDRVKIVLEAEKDVAGSKSGNAYASYLDAETVENLGLDPIKPWLERIRAVQNKVGLQQLIPVAARNGVGSIFGGYVGQDDKDPETYIFNIYQGGTGLPDRDMYLLQNDKFEAIRIAYKGYLGKMLELAGEADSAARANALFEFEKSVAQVQWTREQSSDATKTYNKMTVAQLDAMTWGVDMTSILRAVSPKIENVVVAQPTAIAEITKLFAKADLEVLKDQMIVGSMRSFGDVLPDTVADTNFAFYSKTLSGTPEREARWKRAVGFAEGSVGEEVGKAYAAKFFPAETKAEMDVLVKNVLSAMGRRIDGLGWMQPETKVKARQKLANFTTKIGFPDRWRDYSALEIKRGDLFGNAIRSNNFDFDDNINKLGSPVRRWEWGMLPQTVNAYANFGMNEIVFPAAILQPPFFDPKADPAVNYGGIGAVIGHEISHHFDDQGSKYDENGRLSDWWTPSDIKAFEAAGKSLIAQYDAYEPLPGEHVKGEFTLGENIGDLAGLTIAYDAYKSALNGADAPIIDGTTGDQRFFLGWAQVWRRKYREANLRQRLITDPHSPSEQRAWVVRNLDKWYDAFQPKTDDKLYLAPEKRVRIWEYNEDFN